LKKERDRESECKCECECGGGGTGKWFAQAEEGHREKRGGEKRKKRKEREEREERKIGPKRLILAIYKVRMIGETSFSI